ncbi:MAG: hypothetical protein KBF89_00500 [Acidimicrobiia bacterium]|nr:hypothetical protein [Acidimicrobiia bacterium]
MPKKIIKKVLKNTSKKDGFFWKLLFYGSIAKKILKWVFAKPTPKIVQQIDLEPGEYKIKVQDSKTIEM